MTRTISLITATVGAALLFAVPAYGDNWGADKQQAQTAAVTDRSEGLNAKYGLGEFSPAQGILRRSEALNEKYGRDATVVSSLDARERALTAKHEAQLTSIPAPDVFERAANAAIRDTRQIVVDDRFDLHPQNVPAPVATTSTGREIDFPQVGMGLGIGLLLALGLYLAMRFTHSRPVAH